MFEYKCPECGNAETKEERISVYDQEVKARVTCAHCSVEREIKVILKNGRIVIDII